MPGDLPVDRGFRYGMSVFETLGVWKGRLLFAREHGERLGEAAWALLGTDAGRFVGEAAAIARKDLAGCSGVLRIYVTAGAGAMTAPVSAPGGWMVFEDAPVGPPAGDGLRIAVSPDAFPAGTGGFKTGNYWASVRALKEARAQGFDEALVCDPRGCLVGAACGNVFLLLGDRWVTPSTGCGGTRPGVVRAWVLARMSCQEEELDAGAAGRATACFLTNSRMGVATVRAIGERDLPGHQAVGGLVKAYTDEFLHG